MLSESRELILSAVDAKSDPGRWAEQRALNLLKNRGWSCLDQRWACRYGELDLMMIKPGRSGPRLLMVEVKARRRCGPDYWGLKAFAPMKRRRLARTVACWQSCNPWSDQGHLEVVLALVPLPPSSRPVRWIRVPELGIA
ncbi:uncharacterized protein family UPF0102 [Synechococcus sp. BIOS-E4-1]|nr:uncharacterized protein family UPF0102 [Synechococcus sp. BIOS-E4-1]